jgi:hypothetical protein
MACIGFSLNNFFFSVNSLRWVHIEAYQRRSLAPIVGRLKTIGLLGG